MAETKSGSKNKQIVKSLENYKSENMTDIKSGSIAQHIVGNIAKLSIWRYGKTIIRKNGRKQIWKYTAMQLNSKLEILLKYRHESMDMMNIISCQYGQKLTLN